MPGIVVAAAFVVWSSCSIQKVPASLCLNLAVVILATYHSTCSRSSVLESRSLRQRLVLV